MKKAALLFGILLASASVMPMSLEASAQEAEVQQDESSMLSDAANGVKELDSIVNSALSALDDARNASDVARIDTVNSLLVNARGYLSVAQNAEINLKDAVARNDKEAMLHHYKIVQLAVSKGREIAAKLADSSNSTVSISGSAVQKTERTCNVEPCIGGEEYYEPTKSGPLGKVIEPGTELDPDASSYL